MSSEMRLKVGVGSLDRGVLDCACERQGIQPSRWEHMPGMTVRGTNHIGASVAIKGFDRRAVFCEAPAVDERGKPVLDANGKQDTAVTVFYEDWSPSQGYITPASRRAVEALKQDYNTILREDSEAARDAILEEARKNNQQVLSNTETEDGILVLELQVG